MEIIDHTFWKTDQVALKPFKYLQSNRRSS